MTPERLILAYETFEDGRRELLRGRVSDVENAGRITRRAWKVYARQVVGDLQVEVWDLTQIGRHGDLGILHEFRSWDKIRREYWELDS
jgi:hypothetical protein